MAIVTRYFSTTGAGAADGTSWAARAALFSAGNWSTIITGFNFAGADSLKCFIGPGTYTCSQLLDGAAFTNPPSDANTLFMIGCDSSGVILPIPEPDWMSCDGLWDTSTLPEIATTTNVQTVNTGEAVWHLIKFTATGRTGGAVIQGGVYSWCALDNSSNNAAALGVVTGHMANCWLRMTGAAYDTIMRCHNAPELDNCRIEGVTGTSGSRRGMVIASAGLVLAGTRLTIIGVGGIGLSCSVSTAVSYIRLIRSVVANCGSHGI